MTPRAGLCSIALRKHSVETVVEVAVAAGLDGIEWGADIHVPPGDSVRAARVRRLCADAGVACASYGSYLFAGKATRDDAMAVADIALELGVPNVRIWTPLGVRPDAPPDERAAVIVGVRDLAAVLIERGLTPSLEFHTDTLTHTAQATNALLDAVGLDELRTYWQPDFTLGTDALMAEYEAVAPRVTNLHVFAWASYQDRYPLEKGDALWPYILRRASSGWALIEHVVDDAPAQVRVDAATLRAWLGDD